MSERDSDQRLRDALEEVHRDASPPSFEATMRAAAGRHRPRWTRLLAPAGAVAAAAIALTICVGVRDRGPGDDLSALAYSGSAFAAQTDFLLETPGADWLGSTPSFGVEVDLDVDVNQDPQGSTP